ncbi:pyridoxamine 5'-phosphate oxidase [[Mycobacterium] burgundiense]|uniref:Pyridoxine/pyridoxamine 5'-phosphate oxidase n=1 Tax=[Mycobacterium] burgundiense TaxID=3064286 RepID=A0ABM9LCH7_9MYCO|nr:pyridoxamine 5'-phosphate oxidase [Mycolicibacterium sp. MU0053]CAJ1496715.1 pyridoxamine 5'-phosphate oxidase [Mycolicibacterium sp. MU0053]
MVEAEGARSRSTRVESGSVEKDAHADLDVDWLGEDPATGWLTLLRNWITDAERAGLAEPNAMVLATVHAGKPVCRSVLCKSVEATGITFYTNYNSAKGAELAETPQAAVTFPWYQLGRQVHLRGSVRKVSADETAAYWSKRPRGSQLGAWASQQSQPIASRAVLLERLAEVTARFSGAAEVPVPPHWGGYRIAPETVEFWQGRQDRIHNRIRIVLDAALPAGALVTRLQP